MIASQVTGAFGAFAAKKHRLNKGCFSFIQPVFF
jgi:hypothetical protein